MNKKKKAQGCTTKKATQLKSWTRGRIYIDSIAPHKDDMPNKENEEKPKDCEVLETSTKLKTMAEIEHLLKSTLPKFPTEVITQIALYAEFVQDTCWLCKKTFWEHFDKEYGIFTIYRTGWPPGVRNCSQCHEIWYTWESTPARETPISPFQQA